MKSLIAAVAALVLMLLPATAHAQQGAAAPSQLSLDLAKKWTDAYETGDAGVLAAVYAEDAILAMSGSSRGTGRAAIEKIWADDIAEEAASLTSLTVTHEAAATGRHHIEGDYLVIDRETGVVVGQGAFAQTWELQADGSTWLVALEEWQGGKTQPIPIPADPAAASPQPFA